MSALDEKALESSVSAYSRDQLAKLAFAVFYSPVLCAPQNIKAVIDEIDCHPCDRVSNGGTCSRSERGDYCPGDVVDTLREISAALFGPRDPSHYVGTVFGPDRMTALRSPAETEMLVALRQAKRLTDNINEFGACTDGELYDAACTAIEAAISNAAMRATPNHGA